VTSPRFRLRRATADDLPAVTGLIRAAAEWMNDRGLDAWRRDGTPAVDRVPDSVEAGTVWLMYNGHTAAPVATVTLDTVPDQEFPAAGVDTGSALIVHRMAATRDPAYAEMNIACLLLDFATDQASRHGLEWVMLNCNRQPGAEPLRRRYEECGFEHIATVQVGERRSGWLARKKARPEPGLFMRVAVDA
jgi:GNAT superfamily N-acetyltransferase